ncbi:MAG: SWIM zinc finger family protein [Solirubrobacterales bacterium]
MATPAYHPKLESLRPLPAREGIAAHSLEQASGESWWSRRFIELLESFGVGSRLERGRDYARSGQVSELEVEPGIVLAKVQGSRFTPYRVRIRAEALSEHQWRRAEKAMAAQALSLAQLLAGEMPHDIEELFAACRLTLLPASYGELKASCTCPDEENPCKHLAAAYYILAERFEEDPFLIFTWRGRTREELMESLRTRRGKARANGAAATTAATAAASSDVAASTDTGAPPLSALRDSFWSSGPELSALHISPLAGEAPDALLRQLGPTPVQSGGREIAERLAPAYARLAVAAERRALAE